LRRIFSYLILFLAAVACGEPLSVEKFIPAPGPYEFQVDMTDTLGSYKLDFYTRLDGFPEKLDEAGELPLRITWESPSHATFTENVNLPLQGRSTLFSRQVFQPYRNRMRPQEPGVWKLTVAVPYSDGRDVLRGLGLVVTQSFD